MYEKQKNSWNINNGNSGGIELNLLFLYVFFQLLWYFLIIIIIKIIHLKKSQEIIELINMLPTLNEMKVTLDKSICQMHKCKHLKQLI